MVLLELIRHVLQRAVKNSFERRNQGFVREARRWLPVCRSSALLPHQWLCAPGPIVQKRIPRCRIVRTEVLPQCSATPIRNKTATAVTHSKMLGGLSPKGQPELPALFGGTHNHARGDTRFVGKACDEEQRCSGEECAQAATTALRPHAN